jgi:NAD(P)-dependent dehydrogenase (short-subunit alcohol dehydrogenase family)
MEAFASGTPEQFMAKKANKSKSKSAAKSKQPLRTAPAQAQRTQPGIESKMHPEPDYEPKYPGAGRLKDKVALITGGDSGIGRAVAVAMAREGAKITIVYRNEHRDAADTVKAVERERSEAIAIAGDVGSEKFCKQAVERTVKEFGRLDILVNNAAEQHEVDGLEELTEKQLERTFRTNIFGMFFMAKHALKHFDKGASIINTTSITAYQGNKTLLDYSSTKGAIVTFTRSLSQALMEKEIRVNAVAPGPIWTPLIPASFTPKHVAQHGKNAPMQRPGQPNEVAPCYVFLASDDATYISGQVLHPNGGAVVNG